MTPADHYAQMFLRGIRARVKALEDDLLKGGAADHAAYREKIGELRGLRTADELAVSSLDIIRKGENDE